MTRHHPALHGQKGRPPGIADLHLPGAATRKGTARRKGNRARDIPLQGSGGLLPVQRRGGGEEGLGVGVEGTAEKAVPVSLFHDKPRYMIPSLSVTWRTTERSWAMNR